MKGTVMIGSISYRTLTIVLVMFVFSLGGCALKEERDALYRQNLELQSDLDRARAALEAAESDRDSTASEIARLRAALAEKERLASASIPARTADGGSAFNEIAGVETGQTADEIWVRVPGDVLFAPGQATLRTEARASLDKVASVIKRDYSGNRIRIEGYTDTDPIRKSKWRDNQELSEARAASVRDYLSSRGISTSRMYSVGFGASKPRGTKAQSRRVEIVVLR